MLIPSGYAQGTARNAVFRTTADDLGYVSSVVAGAGSLHEHAARQKGARSMPGRGTVYLLEAPDGIWVVRHYLRGGAFAGVLGDRYMRGGEPRPFAELRVSEEARSRGIATPRVRAAATYGGGAFYRGDIATEYIDHAVDLAVLSLGARQWPLEQRIAAWRAAGALLRMCFETGLVHPDLNLKNILIQRSESGIAAYVIDLDRAHVGGVTTTLQRDRMLERFDRSRAKFERAMHRTVTHDEQRALREGLHA